MAEQRSKRKWVLILGLPVVILVLLVALLPAMISAGLGHGRILALIQPHVNGDADFDHLYIRWRGPQELTALRIHDADGKEVANLDFRADFSLFAMIFGQLDRIDLHIAGMLDGTLHDDGTTSFQKLVKTDPARPRLKESEVFELAGMPELHINLDLRRVNLHDEASGRDLVFRQAVGSFRFEQNHRVSVRFESETEADGTTGHITFVATGDQLFDARGRFTPTQASATFDLEAASLPIIGLQEPGELQRMKIVARSASLTDRFVIELDADAQIEGMAPSKLEGAVTLASLFRDTGEIDFRMENLSGTVSGDRVPSSLVQPFLAATPIVLTRDAGPTLDVNVDFVAGDEMVAAVRAAGSRYNATLDVDATFNLDTGEWHGRRLIIASDHAHPDLIEGYIGLRLQQPTDARIELSSFGLPAVDETRQQRPMSDYAATGAITADGPLLIELENEMRGTRVIHVEQARLTLDSTRLGDGITIHASANVEGGSVEFEEHITHLFDEAGNLDALAAKPIGTVTVRDLPSNVLIQWMPNHAELLTESLGEFVNAELDTRVVDDELEAVLQVNAGNVSSTARMFHHRDRLRITEAAADLTISPKLAALAQTEREHPIALLEPLAVSLQLDPLTLHMDEPFVPNLPAASDAPIRLTLTSPLAAIGGINALAEPIAIQQAAVDLDIQTGQTWMYGVTFAGEVHRHAAAGRVARLNADIHFEPGEEAVYRGEINATSIHVRRLELLLGQERDSITELFGASGSLTADVTGLGTNLSGTLISAMPRIAGQFDLTLDDQQFTLSTDQADVDLHARVAERVINRTPGKPLASIQADVPLQLTVNTFHAPVAVFRDSVTGVGGVALDMKLSGGPVRVADMQQTAVALSDIRLELAAPSLREGITFNLAGTAIHDGGTPGTVAVNGTARELFDADDSLDFEQAKLDLDAEVTRAPAVLIDALLGLNGYLHAAVGPEVNAKLVTKEFSANTGTVDLDVTMPNGFLRGKGRARDGLLHIASDSPLTAQLDLNPLLREMLLSRLHPLLGDVVSTEQPLHASLAGATLPMTGGVSRLNGDVEVHIGNVQFDRRSEMLMMLALARVTDSPRLDGSVDPITARIRQGVIEYDEFNVNIAQLSLPQSGRIDLNTGQVALRTNTMLGSLASAFLPRQATDALGGQVGHIIREINVPIVYSGTFGELKPRIDPEFRLEQRITRILAESLIQDALPKTPNLPMPNIGGILDDLLRGGPKDDSKPGR